MRVSSRKRGDVSQVNKRVRAANVRIKKTHKLFLLRWSRN
jgi:hypothetical protein